MKFNQNDETLAVTCFYVQLKLFWKLGEKFVYIDISSSSDADIPNSFYFEVNAFLQPYRSSLLLVPSILVIGYFPVNLNKKLKHYYS